MCSENLVVGNPLSKQHNLRFTIRFAIVIVVLLLSSVRGNCQSNLLSGFLQKSIGNKAVVILEGDRDISNFKARLDAIVLNNDGIPRKLKTIAEVCDFESIPVGDSFIFLKKYSAVNELPCVTPDEMYYYSNCIQDVLANRFRGGRKNDPAVYIRDILVALPDSDWSSIKQGKAIPVSKLSPLSRTNFSSLLVDTFIGGLYEATEFVNVRAKYEKQSTVQYSTLSANPSLVWHFSDKKPDYSWHILPDAIVPSLSSQSIVENRAVNASFRSTTLGSIVKFMNKQGSNIQLTVHPALESKPLSASGIDASTLPEVARLIRRVFDLDMVQANNRITLSPKRIVVGGNRRTGQAILNAMPYPMRRCVGRDYSLCSQQMVLGLIPSIRKSKAKSFLYSELTEMDKTALAINLFGKALNEVRDNDLDRIYAYENNINILYLKYEQLQRSFMSFQIFYEKDGELAPGPKYTSSRGISRK
jgi:hypothetical protein